MLIARVLVNTVNKGDLAILRDMQGKILVPATEFDKWGLSIGYAALVTVRGERYVPVSDLEEISARFDPRTVTLELQVAAKAMPTTVLNLGPDAGGVIFPADNSFFLNYGLNASGDENFTERRYQFATELGVRGWLAVLQHNRRAVG
jgi:outer membrane usher protein FimD/PapC